MTTEKIICLTRWTFVGKVMSLLFNMLSRYMCLDPDKGVKNNYTYNILLMDLQCKIYKL